MRIENVAFGRLTIGETTYTSDLCIYPDGRVVDGWWRRQGHGLCVEDIADLVAQEPGTIVIGTGVNGRLRPEADLAARLRRQGIELLDAPNAEAAALFNRLWGRCRLAAGFHLTCCPGRRLRPPLHSRAMRRLSQRCPTTGRNKV
jgi:hypothetical protein